MHSVKLTIPKKINALRIKNWIIFVAFLMAGTVASAQANSPYSRYGLGDLVPQTSILNRGMGGVSAAYSDPLSVNFNNPASYSKFVTNIEAKSRKAISGRVVFDVGLNFENHTLREDNPTRKFTSSNALFSYLQVGIPIKTNWGLSFGLRQISRVGYKISTTTLLVPIDSFNVLNEYSGDGGTFLASAGTGYAIKNFSLGFNLGYLFGKKQYSTKKAFINDSIEFQNSNYTTQTSFGNLFFNAGAQYKIQVEHTTSLNLGAYGNLKSKLNASQDIVRETFVRSESGDARVDSVFEQKGVKGKITFPAMFGIGFNIDKKENFEKKNYQVWTIGADFTMQQWSQYRFYGLSDSVQNSWQLKVGAQIRPGIGRYFHRVTYQAGFFVGKDYIHVGQNLPIIGMSFGFGLPLDNYNNLARTQFSRINLSFDYTKRGNSSNLVRENLFRISVGLSLSDLWFGKHKYE
jgi:hypothetical protein